MTVGKVNINLGGMGGASFAMASQLGGALAPKGTDCNSCNCTPRGWNSGVRHNKKNLGW